MNCVLYARVSSKEQEKEGFSIPSQLKLLRKYARENGLKVMQEYVDVETAKTTGRTGFGEMLDYVGESRHDCRLILVEKTDRLYRNIRDWVTLDEYDVEVHFVKENFILSPESKSSEKFLHGIKVLMAKNYIDNLSEEVKKGLLEKAEQGEWPHRAPVGYINNRETHRIEPDPDKGPFVTKLFEWYATGNYSLDRLSQLAKECGLFSRNSQAINKAGVHRILMNPIYYGEFVWKEKRYIGSHEPLISKRLYDQAQAVLTRGNRSKETKRGFAFAGLVKCGRCGCAMTPEIKKGKYIYYHCTNFKGSCDNVYVREERLAELLSDVVKQVQIGDDAVKDIKRALLESQKDKVNYHTSSVESLQRRYGHVQALLDRAYEDKLSSKISEDFWQRKSAAWEDEMIDIRLKIKAHESANLNYFQVGSEILELANSAYAMFLEQDRREQRQLLDTLLSNCTFYHGTLCPTYNEPFDILAKGTGMQLKRGWLYEFRNFLQCETTNIELQIETTL